MAFFGLLVLILGLFFTLKGLFQLIASVTDKSLRDGAKYALLVGGGLLLLGGTLCSQSPL